MKKVLILFVAMLAMVLTACGGAAKEATPKTPAASETPETPKESKTPGISKSNIEKATSAIKDKMMMEDASVKVDKNAAHLFITVLDDSISADYAEETGEEFASLLASNYAEENKSGEKLWDLYDMTITISTGKDNTLREGTKEKNSDVIKWKKK